MSLDKVFLDANILFSAAYGSHAPRSLLDLARKGRCLLMASGYVIEEAKRNLDDPDHLLRLQNFLSCVQTVIEADPGLPCSVALPDKDRPVLMAAVFAGADYLITGDVRHFGKYFGQRIMGVRVLMLRDYLQKINSNP